MNLATASAGGFETLADLIRDLASRKFLGLVAATILLYHGAISEETFRWIFGFYVAGNVGEHVAESFGRKVTWHYERDKS